MTEIDLENARRGGQRARVGLEMGMGTELGKESITRIVKRVRNEDGRDMARHGETETGICIVGSEANK